MGEGGRAGLLLPAVNADASALEAVGTLLLKCVLDDQPVGRGMAKFVFDFLVHNEEAMALRSVDAALDALAEYDSALAASWRALLQDPSMLDELSLSLDAFEDGTTRDDAADTAVTHGNLEAAILAGCRHRLLETRRVSFEVPINLVLARMLTHIYPRLSPFTSHLLPLISCLSPLASRLSPLTLSLTYIPPRLSPLVSRLSPLTSRLSPLASRLSPITCCLSPIASHLSPLASHLSPLTFHLSPLASRL